ncbi:MAG: MerR family DNA-binding transcriptional regulator [Xanthomonadaceae bacterium]|jgi:hypothetical protein|nr:MerR family DNA-binding transcriptional regulator [Xanthomonadaceae bacterium]MDE3072125.1 MerR family DNA-binding transcriptional regulator [Pseudomonadota bacterium]
MKHLTVGEVSRRTGLTVRSLHHYETFGLIFPLMRGRWAAITRAGACRRARDAPSRPAP